MLPWVELVRISVGKLQDNKGTFMANGWNRYEKLVLHEMKENGLRFEKINTVLVDLQIQISALKVKAAVAGGMAGIVATSVVAMIFNYIIK